MIQKKQSYKYKMIAREVEPIIIEAECGMQAEEIADAMIKSGEFKVWATAIPVTEDEA